MAEKQESSADFSRLYTLLLLGAVVFSLYVAKEILLPLGFAILLSFVLTPLVARLERVGLRRIPSVILVVLLAFTAIGGIAWLATNQMVGLSTQLPAYKDNLIARIRAVRAGAGSQFEQATEAIQDIGKELTEGSPEQKDDQDASPSESSPDSAANSLGRNKWFPWLNLDADSKQRAEEDAVAVKVVALPPSPLTQVKDWLGPLVAPLSTAGIVSVLVIFMLVLREDLRNRVVRLCGTSRIHLTTEAINEVAARLSRYLRMQLLINFIYGAVVALGLMAIGVPSAPLWGILGLMLRFLPYVGPWMAAAMPITLSLAISDGWTQPLLTIGLFVALELLVNNVLEPWLYGSSIGVSSFGVIVAAIFWTWLWGPVGLVLAMPLTVCLVVIGKNVPQLSFLTTMFSDQSALRPHEHLYQLLLTAKENEAIELAEKVTKSSSALEFCNDVLIPAVRLAEQDRHGGALSQHQESVIAESTRELVDELRFRHVEKDVETDITCDEMKRRQNNGIALCVPVQDEADEVIATVLRQLLSSAGFACDVHSAGMLVSETVEEFAESRYDVAVLVSLPPLGNRKTRYLCRRLRERFENLYIVAAVFDPTAGEDTRRRLLASGASAVVFDLSDALEAIRRADVGTAGKSQEVEVPS